MVDSILRGAMRIPRPQINPWALSSIVLVIVLLAPIFAVFFAASGDSGGLWSHLFETVLPHYVANTLILMIGVGAISLAFGVSSAWVVVRYDFAGCRTLEWMLLLPAAVPGYLIAYTYTDFLEFAGPIQGVIRDIFGWKSARDYWFPEIRSMGGAMLVIGAVLYPYVYMMARAAFLLTPASLFEASALTGRNLFWSIGLPLARPAIVAGLALVMMETISDFGTVEFFAIETLTLGIFNVWLGMNNLAAASQIAVVAFLFILTLLTIEVMARAKRRFTDTTRRAVSFRPTKQKGWCSVACFGVCAFPVVVGFLIPVGVLLNFVLRGHSLDLTAPIIDAALNTFVLASTVAAAVMISAAFLGFVGTFKGGLVLRRLTAIASVGYAFPGTILAIGVVTAGGAMDTGIALFFQDFLGISHGGWLTSGIGLVIVACVVRFQAVGYGAVTAGLERLPPNLIEASRILGRGFGESVRDVVVPMLRMSLLAGGLLVFVDVMKELPMTLLLRPFNFETLATYVYQFAKDELLEEAAVPALMIIATGIIPVVVMNAALRRVTRG
jgi:iron(III) transport system permease protein